MEVAAPKMDTSDEKPKAIRRSKFNLKSLRLSLKYRPEIFRLLLKMRLCIHKKTELVKKLKKQLKKLKKSIKTASTVKCSESELEKPTDIDIKDSTMKSNESSHNIQSNQADSKDPSANISTKDTEAGWNLKDLEEGKSIADQVKEAAQSALQQSGMVYVESAGMYYDYKTGYYYNSELGLYYHTDTGCYYYYNEDKKEFAFHSYPDRSAAAAVTNPALEAHEKRKARKQRKDGPTKAKRKKKEKKQAKKTKSGDEKQKTDSNGVDNSKTEQEPEGTEEKNVQNVVKGVTEDKNIENVVENEIEKNLAKDKNDKNVAEDENDEKVANDKNFENVAEDAAEDKHIENVPVDKNVTQDKNVAEDKNVADDKNVAVDKNVAEDKNNEIVAGDKKEEKVAKEEKAGEENGQELEDGECSDTESDSSESSEEESTASTASMNDDDIVAKHHPPCMRVIVKETKLPKLKVGSLYLVTKDGGTIGREGDQHTILLKDNNVSRNHLDIRYDMQRRMYTATDLGSKNGTILNGVQMSESQVVSLPMEVMHGSIIQLGETKLLCHIHPGNDTCGHCEPGLIMQTEEKVKVAYTRTCGVKKQYELELARLKNKYKPEPLMIEDGTYNDRARARRETVGSSHHSEKTQMADLDTEIAPENKGFKMMQKMGWSKGEGLGKDGQGDTAPIPLVSNEGTAGLGAPGSAVAPNPMPLPKVRNTLGQGTLRLAARSKLLQPPAKAFQADDDEEEED